MRNRTKSKKPTQTASYDLQAAVATELTPNASNEETLVETEHASPAALKRVPTREEIVQTEDGRDDISISSQGKRPWTQYRRIIFVLGCLLGVLVAWVFRSPDLQLESLLDSVDMADFFGDLKSALPSALPIGLVKEAREIQEHSRRTAGTGAFSIGEQMAREGMTANYPVVMVCFLSAQSFGSL